MSDNGITIICAIIGSGIIGTLITRFLDWLKNRKKKPSALEQGLMWLLHDRLEYLMCKYMEQADAEAKETGEEPSIPKHKVSFINTGYNYYKSLGANGDLAKMHDDFSKYKIDYKE